MPSEQYSAFVEEREIVGCILEDQEIGLDPRKAMNPEVERRSEVSPAQSESQKVYRENKPFLNVIPRVEVPRRYLRMHLTAGK